MTGKRGSEEKETFEGDDDGQDRRRRGRPRAYVEGGSCVEESKEETGLCDSHEHVPPAPQSLRTSGSGGASTGTRCGKKDMPVMRGGTTHCAAGVSGVQVRWEGAGLNHTPRAVRAAIWAEPVRGRHG